MSSQKRTFAFQKLEINLKLIVNLKNHMKIKKKFEVKLTNHLISTHLKYFNPEMFLKHDRVKDHVA